ncbi:hypothetical protein P175DRAFT_0171349 [Aspergillus ochraceoroseus IBT 24754]|uniref:Secreted protein n=1 Tax=Aspergillus ochraceoroseus IBT 24754 TaxID=1392256 RepID=A0A2T5M4I2_9EURO|nr:uncharacterized protein P175DRAFT_0171349 [Aspergillus ochraceoroseus IBT 24754]PTU23416.1 hypothetical protein P175DRAFT_0171349 [Aspergillus ochraceoroseus IBT 24754]
MRNHSWGCSFFSLCFLNLARFRNRRSTQFGSDCDVSCLVSRAQALSACAPGQVSSSSVLLVSELLALVVSSRIFFEPYCCSLVRRLTALPRHLGNGQLGGSVLCSLGDTGHILLLCLRFEFQCRSNASGIVPGLTCI